MANSVVKLTIDSQEYDAKLKSAGKALNDFFDICKKGDRTFEVVDEGVMEAVQAMGKMETASKSAKGSLAELQKAFTDMSLTYRRFTDEEKQSPVGKAMAQSLAELKTRINDTKKDLEEINKELSGGSGKFGEFGNVLDTIGHKLGLTANATELLTSKTALMYAGIGAGIAIIGKATTAWASYNAELAKQDQITTVTTGLKGTAADNMTDSLRALSQTYNVDFRESVNAANVLMTQFGKTGEEAVQLLKDGMQGMIMGDGPKMLSMIQQFAPAFRDAGLSADKLIAIIHNSEGGLFSEQNMNAILMGIKNIRLMTKSTSDALAKLGLDGQKMSERMSNGSLTVFEALRMVAEAIEKAKAGSQEAGEVMQYVFGRQGAMQGMKLGRAIAELNTNLEDTKKQTGDLGDAYADLQAANEKLNVAIRECFGYDGWEEMTIGIKTGLIEALLEVINVLATIKNTVASVIGSIGNAIDDFTGVSGRRKQYQAEVQAIIEQGHASEGYYSDVQKDVSSRIGSLKNSKNKNASFDKDIADLDFKIERAVSELELAKSKKDYYDSRQKNNILREVARQTPDATVLRKEDELKILQEAKNSYIEQANALLPIIKPPKTTNTTTAATTKELSPMQQAQKEISALTEEALTADEDRLEVIKKEIAALNEQLKVYKEIQDYVSGKTPNFNVTVGDRKAFEREQLAIFEANGGTNKNAFNEKNLSSFISDLKSQIQTADLGSELYNNLTKQLADANAIGNLMQTAIKNGIDISQFNPQDLWNKVFGHYPGDYIRDEQLEEIRKKIEEIIGKPIKLDVNTGDVSTSSSNETKDALKDATSKLSTVSSGLSSVSSGLSQMGVNLPSAVTDALNFVGGLISVINGVTSVIEAFSSSSVTAQISSQTANTSALTALTAAVAANTGAVITNTASGIISPLFNSGGIVPHAANGYFVPGTHYSGDVTPIMANAGELVLSRAQQSNLASMLSQKEESGYGGTPYVSGEQIFLGLNNYLKRSGRGELITARG